MFSLGLIVTGDYALATGADRHVAFAASLLARSGQGLAWAWLIPADRVQIAAALYEAWQRSNPVACFGGLGDGVDDHVRATIAALQAGREAVGLSKQPEREEEGCFECGNIIFLHGNPVASHTVFERWLVGRRDQTNATGPAVEQLRWTLPETAAAIDARRVTKQAFPAIGQRLIAAADGALALSFTGPSKGKVQAARKRLQRELDRS